MFMFIVTAKLNRKRALAIVIVIALLLCAAIILAARRDQAANQGNPGVLSPETETAADVVAFLENLGWQIGPEPIEVQEILIPREFNQVYEAYNALQQEAGFNLADYKGRPAVRYTHEILNYPGQAEGVVADVLVAEGRIIGGAIQSIQVDGFIHRLFPYEDG